MEFKGTKGIWGIHEHAVACVSSGDMIVANCAVRTSNINTEQLEVEQSANAQLISCAPEMLEMLDQLVAVMKDIETVPSWLFETYSNTLANAEGLIQRATTI